MGASSTGSRTTSCRPRIISTSPWPTPRRDPSWWTSRPRISRPSSSSRNSPANPGYEERKDFDPSRPLSGRKIKVLFKDGETIVGTTQGYQPGRPGFFLVPADPNQQRALLCRLQRDAGDRLHLKNADETMPPGSSTGLRSAGRSHESAPGGGAILASLLAAAHSYLGERYILIRLFRRGDLPKLFGGTQFTRQTLRFAWHITSVAWLGFAGLLVALAWPGGVAPRVHGQVIGATFAVSGLVALVASKGRHLSWIAFLGIALLTFWASR